MSYDIFRYKNKMGSDRAKPKVYHLQHVNNTHSKLKEWIRKFHGVSDKYMINYLSYYLILESLKKFIDPNKSYREMSLL